MTGASHARIGERRGDSRPSIARARPPLRAANDNARRRLSASTDPASQTTKFAYNGEGQLIKRTDPRNKVTQWAYDVEGRLTGKTYADNSTLTTVYETTNSRVHTVTDALGQVKTFAYYEDDRGSAVTYTGAVHTTPNVSFVYDPNFPRLTSMTDGTGTTSFGYVPVGTLGALQTQQESQPLATIAYVYDKLGRVTSRTVTGAGAETFAYDAIGRLQTHASDLGSFTLGYLGQTGQITSRALPSPSTLATTWAYQPNSGDRRLASITTTGLTAGQSTAFAYATNAENFITGTTQTSDATAAYPASALTQTTTINNLNQLTKLSGQTLTWDADGNLLADATRTYSWDAENRLVGISYPGVSGKATAFAYDGLGRRTQIASTPAGGGSAVTTNYVWCGAQLCQARTAAGAQARGYYAEGEYVPGAPSTSLYYAPDNLGSVRRVFSASQAPSYDYDPYGAPNQSTAPVTDFNYAGTFYNKDSGLYLTTYRPYDSVAGRFLSRDPIGEDGDPGGNLYAYVGEDPIDDVDPVGLVDFKSLSRFQWHGNWGGPGWSNGGWNPESGNIPSPDDPNYKRPTDPEDKCYYLHDLCTHNCPQCPTHGNQCVKACDQALHRCLDALPHKAIGSMATSFAMHTFIPGLFH